MMTESGMRYLFIVMNTDRNDKNGTHWWSSLDLHPKKEIFLFDSFGFEGFKQFVLQNDQNVLNKLLYGIEKFNKRDNKITLITLKSSIREYEKIKNKNRLSEIVIDLLHLMNEYRKKHDLKDEVIIHLVDDQLQMLEKDTYGMHQIYFNVNLFNTLENSSIINNNILNKRTTEKLLNEILSTDRQENEYRIEQFTEKSDMQHGKNCETRKTCLGITISFYKKWLASDRFILVSVDLRSL